MKFLKVHGDGDGDDDGDGDGGALLAMDLP